ncbi:helix-turn-helix transcriptional regulator [Clostridium sp. HMP27]|uniref:helix-turn-helix domain-containing protein n=1 Tax=Clostridium sp. HMP27 TaxID=1487921 RepID=UPI00052B95DA|nr:helix-turn-helix transcriptional regulator [Clostridium sp. HMP27]KGK88001.1 DNA-binding protein [Clostridium sp. HMP27]
MAVLKTKEARMKKNMSLSQLSYKSGVARGYLTELESGKYSNPGIQVIGKLCKALKLTPNELIDESLWKWEE